MRRRGTPHIIFPGLTRPVCPQANTLTTAPELCHTDTPLTRPGLPAIRSYFHQLLFPSSSSPPNKLCLHRDPWCIYAVQQPTFYCLQTYKHCVDSSLSVQCSVFKSRVKLSLIVNHYIPIHAILISLFLFIFYLISLFYFYFYLLDLYNPILIKSYILSSVPPTPA